MKFPLRALFCVTVYIAVCESARILGIFPAPSISHQVVYRAITNELARRGHELVVLTPDPQKSLDPLYKNVTEIDVHDISYKIFTERMTMLGERQKGNINKLFMETFYSISFDYFYAQMQHPIMQKILNDTSDNFDLVIAEFFDESAYGFAWKFNIPLIVVGSCTAPAGVWELTGNPTHPLVYYDLWEPFLGENTFMNRLEGIYNYLYYRYMYVYHARPLFNKQLKRIFGPDVPDIREIEKLVDMLFINWFPINDGIRPVTPVTIHLGALHINERKPLSEKLQEYLDASKQGVIYFSLGSNVKSNQLLPEKRQAILDAFNELPYNVMWKYEDDVLPNKPQNVFTSKWFPQYDIFGHPNVKLFIFQGGQQSMEEAILSTIPMIGIPFIGDQDKNVRNIVNRKIGLSLDIATMTKETFKETILEVINNKEYKKNIVKLSEIINDDPMTPRERAVWWTEYVLRHKGAKHLRSPVLDLPTYQYFMLDIIGALIATILLTLYIVYKILWFIFFNQKSDKLKTS